ncbi:glycosyltransferase [Gordonia sp. NPDC062954]|uniref:glycosyltransferase n=1 Tax=Gordonia sp. NPDC062954 TaxID=3364003 RepID=UPI0037CBB82A
MRYVFAAGGSRGDVQPAAALATELRVRGHEVTLLVPPDSVPFASGTGIPTLSYGESTRAALDSPLVRERMRSRDPLTRVRAATELTIRGGSVMQRQLLDATQNADAIIAGSAGQERAHNVSRVRGIPHIPLHLCPIRRNGSTTLLAHAGIDVGPRTARMSWRLVEQVLWRAGRRAEDALCADLGLDPIPATFAAQIAATGVPEIQAYDPVLFPTLTSEWGPARPLVGFFTLPHDQRSGVGDDAGSDLIEWIDRGTPPVYVGFGSMMVTDPDHLATTVLAVAAELDLRLLIAGGWSDFMSGVSDDRIRVVGHVDHDAILPRCAAAVHHGGAGSVAAGLRAGIPTVVTWVGADQPIWGRAVMASHVGTSLPMSRVNTTRLVTAVRSALSPSVREAATTLRDSMIHPSMAVSHAADIAERVADRHSRQDAI